jgi:hypothetical protein
MRWPARRPMPRISIRANRRRGCLRIVARRVIAARPVSPGDARVPRYSSSCRSITRPVRTRPRSLLLIWPRSTQDEPAGRGRRRRSRRALRHPGRRSVHPKRCHPRAKARCHRALDSCLRMIFRKTASHFSGSCFGIETIGELSFVAAFQQRRIAHDCEATIAGLRLGTTTSRVNSPLL